MQEQSKQGQLWDEPLVCKFPQFGPSTAYRYGCRCSRCRNGKAQATPYCATTECRNLRVKGSRFCEPCRQTELARKRVQRKERRRHKRGLELEFVCEIDGTRYTVYESVIDRQRENLRELWRRVCPACRARVRSQVRAHQLDTDWAIRLLRATHCDYCERPLMLNNKGEPICVIDHDHRCCPHGFSCGRCVRGILHPGCNTALGHVESALNIVGWERTVVYLDINGQDQGLAGPDRR
jgi:Recombination endonuclease VII